MTDEELDTLLLGTERTPGKVTLSGHDRVDKWDVKQSDGSSGASVTHKGEEAQGFTATFALVQGEANGQAIDEIADFDARIMPLLNGLTGGKNPIALDIYHPDLARNRIGSVVKAKVGGLVRDGKGGATIAVGFQEYFPPKPKTGSPTGSKSKASGSAASGERTGTTVVSAPDPNAEAKAELAALVAEANAP